MAVRRVLKMGHPLLRLRAEEIPENEIGSKELKKLIRDMYDTMEHAEGIGLAAPQIGVSRRIIAMGSHEEDAKSSFGRKRRVLINPVIEPLEGPKRGYWEACLSVPGLRGYVERPRKIHLRWLDESGEAHDRVIEGFEAVVCQHECDHLNGTLYVDHIKDTSRFGFSEELDKLDDAS